MRAGLIALALGGAVMAAASVEDLRLVPFPKEVELRPGRFEFSGGLTLEAPAGQQEMLGRILNEELARTGCERVSVRSGAAGETIFRLARLPGAVENAEMPAHDSREAYGLAVGSNGVMCVARDGAGLFYGLETFCQLIRANRTGASIPCVRIRDWPSLRWRCFQDDMTRGPSSRLETLKFEAGLGAWLKFNLMTYYMEYQFAFKKHPQIGPTNGSLTAGELAELVKFAKPLHMDIVGNQQSFGHFGQILKHPEFAGLRETAEVLTPVKEETYWLLEDLYAEVCPVLPFGWFNVCCDETWGLGTGPSKALAEQIGVGGVYVRHLGRVHELLRRQNKRMMMWGDIILQHPEQLSALPKDTIMLTWGYDARASFEEQIIPFARSGYEFFVCPGVNNWSRILPDIGVAMTNIQHFVRDGVKHGALGMLNTDWADDGEALKAVKWHADAWAAECAWNGATTPAEVFNRRVGAVLFGEAGDHFGQAMELLGRTHRLPGMQGMLNSRFWQADFSPRSSPAKIESSASNLLAFVQPAIAHLEACRREAGANVQVLDQFLFGARRMERIGQRTLDGLEAARAYELAYERATERRGEISVLLSKAEDLVRRNRDAHEALGKAFAGLWLAESKPYALDWTMRRYEVAVKGYETLLAKLEGARAAAGRGEGMPEPQEIGLALPETSGRAVRARAILPSALAPESKWLEPEATNRLGLLVRAGAADRFELPVEVNLKVPMEFVGKPVRAFRLSTTGEPSEVLAQLDASDKPGRGRLVLVLEGLLPKGTEAAVQVYLGLREPATLLPHAVSARQDAKGLWIENDKLRLLVGAEGAHIYRWELKRAGNRDLTEPGEKGWAGFSDMAMHRARQYRLVCAANGPALARCECLDDSGVAKTISVFGGASWAEVMLSKATPLYWDFDDPRNFAADGPTPGTYLFSNGATGKVGRQADGVPAQVKVRDVHWGIKYNPEKLALGLATPETGAFHHVAPGSGAGGVGIENSPLSAHFVTFGGVLELAPGETMNRLCQTLDLRHPPEVVVYALQRR